MVGEGQDCSQFARCSRVCVGATTATRVASPRSRKENRAATVTLELAEADGGHFTFSTSGGRGWRIRRLNANLPASHMSPNDMMTTHSLTPLMVKSHRYQGSPGIFANIINLQKIPDVKANDGENSQGASDAGQ